MPGPCRGAFERCVGLAECGRSRRGSWLTQKDVCQLQSIMYLTADSQSLKPCAFLVPWAAVSQDDPHSAFFLPHTGDPAEQGRCLHVVMTVAVVCVTFPWSGSKMTAGQGKTSHRFGGDLEVRPPGVLVLRAFGALRFKALRSRDRDAEENLPTTATESTRQRA